MRDLAAILYGEGSNNRGAIRETMEAVLKITPPRFEITESRWDFNGSHRVTVRDNETRTASRKAQRKARDLAKQVVAMPHLTVWTRLDRTEADGSTTLYTFTVSRLDRSYR